MHEDEYKYIYFLLSFIFSSIMHKLKEVLLIGQSKSFRTYQVRFKFLSIRWLRGNMILFLDRKLMTFSIN
jgi:hypothetical protein